MTDCSDFEPDSSPLAGLQAVKHLLTIAFAGVEPFLEQ